MEIDILATYFPETAAIPASDLKAARAQVVNYLQPAFPDEDLSPGSVIGDTVVSILALWVAARKISLDRFTSDLDPANVAANIIYNCDFVARYLDNFGVYDVENLSGSGMVRLTFSVNQGYSLNQSVKFKFGTDEEMTPRLVAASGITIVAAGTAPSTDPDVYRLSQTSGTTWSVDIPITGVVADEIPAGTTGSISKDITELIGIVSAVNIIPGTPPTSLSELAQLTRMAAHSATPSNRLGTRSMIFRNWPETQSAEVVVNGDPEVLRTVAGTALSLPGPAMDIYYQSQRDMSLVTQVVRIPFDPVLEVFRGPLELLHRPSIISSLLWTGDETLDLSEVSVFTQTPGVVGSVALGSRQEELWVEVIPPVVGSVIQIDRLSDVDGLYALFEISYYADPLLASVSAALESSAYAPVGVDVMVKAGAVAYLSGLDIKYTRVPGTTMKLGSAREEIGAYVRASGYRNAFSSGDIAEIMRAAGADRVRSVTPTGTIRMTPAVKRFDPAYDPSADSDWDANSSDVKQWPVTAEADLSPSEIFSGTYDGAADKWAVTEKDLRMFIDDVLISFTEV